MQSLLRICALTSRGMSAVQRAAFSDVLGWASSPEPAEPSPFKPKPSPAPMRACKGLGLGFRYQKPEPRTQARALIYCSLACRSAIGKVKYYYVSKDQFNSMKIKLGSRTSSTSSVDPISISFDPTAVNMSMNNRIVYLGQIGRT